MDSWGHCKGKHAENSECFFDSKTCSRCEEIGEVILVSTEEGSDLGCGRVHEKDVVKCRICGFRTSMKKYISEIIKKGN